MEEHVVEVGGIGVENVLANEFESHFNHIAYILEAVFYGKIRVHGTEICSVNAGAVGEETLRFGDVAKDPNFAGTPLKDIDFVLL